MLEALSLWSVLSIARSVLLIAGVCALAVWAMRQPDQQSSLVARLTGRRNARPADPCALAISTKTRQSEEE